MAGVFAPHGGPHLRPRVVTVLGQLAIATVSLEAAALLPSLNQPVARLVADLDPRALVALALMPPDEVDEADISAVARTFDVPATDLEETRDAVFDRRLGMAAGRYPLADAVAAHAVSAAVRGSRAQWLRTLARSLPNSYVPIAIEVLGASGPVADHLVSALIERAETQLPTDSDDPHRQPDTFCRSLIMRMSRSEPLSAAGMRRSVVKRR